MINLRYHIVSLVAVFLALALGIVMGSTVIDQAIVDRLEERVNSVDARADRTANENRTLRGQLDLMNSFAGEARDQLVEGHLRGVPVLVVSVQGVDRKPIEALRETLVTSEAVSAGTLLLTNKLRLENEGDMRALATTLNVNLTAPDTLRFQFVNRLGAVLDGASGDSTLIPALAAAGFVGYEPPEATTTAATVTLGLTSFPVSGLRVVLASGAGAEVADDRLARPLVQAMTPTGARSRVVAAESGQDTPGGRAVFVGPIRSDGSLSQRVSTIDNLETPIGQASVVLALEDLSEPRSGHYGVGPGAERLLPPVEP